MIRTIVQRFLAFNIWLKIIWALCVCGCLFNLISVVNDMYSGGILLHLHIGFLVLYAGQVVFILLEERLVWILSFLQGIMALLSNLDFTFLPLVRMVGSVIYGMHGAFSVEHLETYKYIFVSTCFTLEMLKTILLFLWLSKVPPESAAEG